MLYKGYIGQVDVDEDEGVLHGRVVNIRDTITFVGKTVAESQREFKKSVDVYLAWCAERGEEPEPPCSGKFIVRLNPEIHRALILAAAREHKSLNAFVKEALEERVHALR